MTNGYPAQAAEPKFMTMPLVTPLTNPPTACWSPKLFIGFLCISVAHAHDTICQAFVTHVDPTDWASALLIFHDEVAILTLSPFWVLVLA